MIACRAQAGGPHRALDFVRDGGQWKIDDIRSASDGEPWSIRSILEASLKN